MNLSSRLCLSVNRLKLDSVILSSYSHRICVSQTYQWYGISFNLILYTVDFDVCGFLQKSVSHREGHLFSKDPWMSGVCQIHSHRWRLVFHNRRHTTRLIFFRHRCSCKDALPHNYDKHVTSDLIQMIQIMNCLTRLLL